MLKRKRYPMPDYIKIALSKNKLTSVYLSRPPYQRNDYIGWINRAVQEKTRQKRLNQMISELKKGNSYMKMAYRAKDK
jgi:uncharacterized protein YdeI (YjbR/CyaY-like superfamily)